MAEQWYYTKNGQPQDPVSAAELKRLAASGQLKPTDLVWKEGMANWIKASASKGLFGDDPVTATTAKPASKPTSKARFAEVDKEDWNAGEDEIAELDEVEDDEPRARRKRSIRDMDEDEWDEDQPRRRKRYEDEEDEDRPRRRKRRTAPQGVGAGTVIGMLAGGLLVIGLLIGAVVFAIFSGAASMEGSYNWSLRTNEKFVRTLTLLAGHRVELRVNSTGQSDVDLFIFDGSNQVAKDESLSSNCAINFTPPATKRYRLEVWNRDLLPQRFRNGPNNGTLTYKQIKPGEPGAPNMPVQGNQPPIPGAGGFDLNQAGQLQVNETRTFNIVLNSNFNYTIDLRSDDFDALLKLQDNLGRTVAVDDDGGGDLNSRIVFRPPQTRPYRVLVSALDREPGAFTLTVRH